MKLTFWSGMRNRKGEIKSILLFTGMAIIALGILVGSQIRNQRVTTQPRASEITSVIWGQTKPNAAGKYIWSNGGPTAGWESYIGNKLAICNGQTCWAYDRSTSTWDNQGQPWEMSTQPGFGAPSQAGLNDQMKAAGDGTLPWSNNGPTAAWTWELPTQVNGYWVNESYVCNVVYCWRYLRYPNGVTGSGWKDGGAPIDLRTAAVWKDQPGLSAGSGVSVGWNDPVNKKATLCNQSSCWSLSYGNGWVWQGAVNPFPAGTSITKFTAAWTSPETKTESLCAGNLCYRYNLQTPVGWQTDQDLIAALPTSTPIPTVDPHAGEKPSATPTPRPPTPASSSSVANCTIQGIQQLNNYVGQVKVNGVLYKASPYYAVVPGNKTYTVELYTSSGTAIYSSPVLSTYCSNRTDCHSPSDASKKIGYIRTDVYCPAGGYADVWYTSREPNCSNFRGPTTITLGQSGIYSIDYSSYEGNLTGEIYLNNFEKSIASTVFGATATKGTVTGSWTPTAVGNYVINCRAWNDGIAECRSGGYTAAQPECNGDYINGVYRTFNVSVVAPTAIPTPTTKPTSTPVPMTDAIIRLNEIESAPTTNDRPTIAAYALNSNFQRSICAGDGSIPNGYRCSNLVPGTTYTYRATSTARSTSNPTIVSEISGVANGGTLYDLWMTYADKVTISPAIPAPGQAVTLTVTGKKLRAPAAKLTVKVTGAGGFTKEFSEELPATTDSTTTFTKTYSVTPTTAGSLAVDLTVAEGYTATIPASVLSYKSFSFTVQTNTCSLKAKGDANCDGAVDLLDYSCWRGEFLGSKPTNCVSADFNGLNGVDILDFTIWKVTFLATP